MDEGAGAELVVDDVVVAVEVEDAVPDPVRVADAAIAESVESLLGSVRGTTNDVDADADADAEGGVNVRGRGVVMGVMGAMGVMGGGGCACAAIAVLGLSVSLFSSLRAREGDVGSEANRGRRGETGWGVCLGRVESQAGGKDGGGLDEIRIV